MYSLRFLFQFPWYIPSSTSIVSDANSTLKESSHPKLQSSKNSSALNNPENNDNCRNNKQDMDNSSCIKSSKSQYPKNNQHDSDEVQ